MLLVLYYLLNKISAVGVGLFLTHVIQTFPITPEGCQVQKTKFIEIDVISKMFLANKIFFFSPNCSFLYQHASAVSVMQFLQWLSKSGAAVKPSQPWLQSWFRPCVSGSGLAPTCGGCGWAVPVRTAPGEPGPSLPAYALTAQPSSTQHRSHSICCSCAACSGMTHEPLSERVYFNF